MTKTVNDSLVHSMALLSAVAWFISKVPQSAEIGVFCNGRWRTGDELKEDCITLVSDIESIIRAAYAERDQDIRSVLVRCIELLEAVARYMKDNLLATEYYTFYDDAECDGFCLQEDCNVAVAWARNVLEKLN